MDFIWNIFIILISSTILLQLAGRKSIAQASIMQVMLMISMVSILTFPVASKSILRTIITASIFVSYLVLVEFLHVKFNFMENLIIGKAKLVIQDGTVVEENLKKLRLSVDQLEMYLREYGITKISDVKTATLEVNGKLGYELMRHAKPVTIGELENILTTMLKLQNPPKAAPPQDFNIFTEIKENRHQNPNPSNLQ